MWEQGVFPVGDMHPFVPNVIITSEPWPWNRKHRKHTMFRRRVPDGNDSLCLSGTSSFMANTKTSGGKIFSGETTAF